MKERDQKELLSEKNYLVSIAVQIFFCPIVLRNFTS